MNITLIFLLVFPFLCHGIPSAPVAGVGLEFPINGPDLTKAGITVTPIMGSVNDEEKLRFPIARGSAISYVGRDISGRVGFKGGIRFSKQTLQVTVSNFILDLKTGVITAVMDSVPNVRFGMINTRNVEISKKEGSVDATITPADSELLLDQGFLTQINNKLGTQLHLQDHRIPGELSLDVSLILEGKINSGLIVALGLDADIAPDMTAQEVQHMIFDVDVSFN